MKKATNWSIATVLCAILLFFIVTTLPLCNCGCTGSGNETVTNSPSKSNPNVIGPSISKPKDTGSQYRNLLMEFVDMNNNSKPILVDLGSTSCVPCIEMKPILEDFETNYTDYFHTFFVDVNKDRSLSSQFGVQFIPTQIFFDAQGNELERHVGFFSKEEMLAVFAEHGFDVGDK
jgi:thioredoxin 1